MTVSTRNTIFAGAGALALIALGGFAYAGGGSCGGGGCGGSMSGGGVKAPGGGTVVPGASMGGGHGVTYGGGMSGGGSGCCGGTPKGQSVVVPGVNVAGPNVMVTGPNVTVNQGSLINNSQSFVNNSFTTGSGQGTIFIGGGGGYYPSAGVAPSAIGALNVEGNVEKYMETVTEQVPSTEEYCDEQISVRQTVRPVQAVCLDDTGTPHPASRVDASQRVPAGYAGELFRCMAGTSMQVTLGNISNGSASFAQGETFSCRKGEALAHQRGGNLACVPQAPQRSCNERSLLRRHGPGIKIVEATSKAKTCVPKTRTVMKSVQRQVERTRQVKGNPMVFDGGVGQGLN